MTKEELQAIYFGFYDQLNEPERSEAKADHNDELSIGFIPKTLSSAIDAGIGVTLLWAGSAEKEKYWVDILDRIRRNEYFQSETLTSPLTLTINSLTDSEVTAYMGINDELRKAELKHPDWPTHDLYKQLAIITEEVGEVSRAIQNLIDGKGTIEELREELHQSAAMHLRMLKHLKG